MRKSTIFTRKEYLNSKNQKNEKPEDVIVAKFIKDR